MAHGPVGHGCELQRTQAPKSDGSERTARSRCLVEMAGIEPASEEFARGPTTSLVGLAKRLSHLYLTRPRPAARQPMVFRNPHPHQDCVTPAA